MIEAFFEEWLEEHGEPEEVQRFMNDFCNSDSIDLFITVLADERENAFYAGAFAISKFLIENM